MRLSLCLVLLFCVISYADEFSAVNPGVPTRSPQNQKVPQPSQPASPNAPAAKDAITILSWNVESGGSDPAVIATQLKDFAKYDVVCLSEVSPNNFNDYWKALGSDFKAINGKTGRDDSLQILFNEKRFEELQRGELARYRDIVLNNGSHRTPLFVRLRVRATGSEFIVMTNHLARGNAELRKQQAIGLREWARDQNVAVITVGDFNMDFDFKTERGNDAFPEMIRDNVWSWVRPIELIDTNWADKNADGVDEYPDSMLDFAFVAGPAKSWSPKCSVVVRPGDFPDDRNTSDHRPIELTLSP
jgi:endonuclease/exonuclease/phosphatase family metal-dependent hydrolase